MSRPDIFVALQRASKWVAKPSQKLWRWLTRILQYLAGTRTLGLIYQRTQKAPLIQGYVDASYADEPECKSTAGWVMLINGALTAFDSTTIKRVVTSSTEAECHAMTIIGKENTWQRRLLQELYGVNIIEPTPVKCDNSAAITMLGTGVTKRSRHYAIEWFKMQDLIEQREMVVEWVCTEDNLADFFTKKLPRQRFIHNLSTHKKGER